MAVTRVEGFRGSASGRLYESEQAAHEGEVDWALARVSDCAAALGRVELLHDRSFGVAVRLLCEMLPAAPFDPKVEDEPMRALRQAPSIRGDHPIGEAEFVEALAAVGYTPVHHVTGQPDVANMSEAQKASIVGPNQRDYGATYDTWVAGQGWCEAGDAYDAMSRETNGEIEYEAAEPGQVRMPVGPNGVRYSARDHVWVEDVGWADGGPLRGVDVILAQRAAAGAAPSPVWKDRDSPFDHDSPETKRAVHQVKLNAVPASTFDEVSRGILRPDTTPKTTNVAHLGEPQAIDDAVREEAARQVAAEPDFLPSILAQAAFPLPRKAADEPPTGYEDFRVLGSDERGLPVQEPVLPMQRQTIDDDERAAMATFTQR